MFSSVAGRSVVVTGGGRGIGRGIARVFTDAGAKVALRGQRSALFFGSDETGYITGQTLVVDGGQVLPEG